MNERTAKKIRRSVWGERAVPRIGERRYRRPKGQYHYTHICDDDRWLYRLLKKRWHRGLSVPGVR